MDAGRPLLALQRGRGALLSGLRAAHVGELAAELDPLLRGARVREVQALPPRDLLLVLEPRSAAEDGPPVLRLRLSADPDAARLHLQHGRVHAHDGPVGPFFQRLADEIAGATLRRIAQVGGDRIALLELGDAPGGRRRALVAELVGRHANLALLGPGDEVLDVLVPPPPAQHDTARLVAGSPWSPPGGATRAPSRPEPPLREAFPDPPGPPPGRDPERAPLSWRVELALGAAADEHRTARERRRVAARVARKLRRAKSHVAGIERRAQAAEGAEQVRQDGELLKSELGRLRRGMTSARVRDWFTDGAPERVIELDAGRSPRENVERTFERYRKLERAKRTVTEELALARERLAALEELAQAVERPEEDPLALEADAVRGGLLDPAQEADPRKRRQPPPRLPYRTFTAADGSEVRVGRSARDNDALTFRHARGNDVWLHTADVPGSHVVLATQGDREPDPEALLDAATLAVHFSPARGGSVVPVHVARRKQVHKPRGAKPGLVSLSAGRILQVRVQQERLDRLLRSSKAPRTSRASPDRAPPGPPPRTRPRSPPSRPMRSLPLSAALLAVLACLAGCSSDEPPELTTEQKLGLYFENALRYYNLRDLERAYDQVQRGLELDPKNERFLLMLGNIHQLRGTADDILAAEQIFRRHPNQKDYRVKLGLGAALERKGVLQDEASKLIRSGERYTEAPDPEARADELERDARRNWDAAHDAYEAAIAIHAGEIQATNGLIRTSALQGRYDDSIRWGRELIEVLASSTRVRRIELEDADIEPTRESQLREAIRANEEMAVKTYLHIATLQYREGKTLDALGELGKVLELAPELAEVYSRRAQLFFELGEYSQAKDSVERYLKLSAHLPYDDPDVRAAYELRERCNSALADAQGG